MPPHPEIDVAQAMVFWKDYSRELYAVPRAWAHKGENLIHAFRAVSAASEPDSMHLNMQDQALMLAGMAIEVQLKAILVGSPAVRTVVTGGRPQKNDPHFKLWQRFFSHNLLELALEAGFTLTEAEQRTAVALSQYIYWRGRYIVPTERGVDDFIPVELADGLAGQVHHISLHDATELIDRVVAEVKARLYA